MLLTIDQILPRDKARDMARQLQAQPWRSGADTAGSLAREVKHNEQLDERSPLAQTLGCEVLQAVGAHPLFVSAALPRRIFPPRFNRYADGGTYGAHVDSAVMQLPGTSDALRTDLSATLFLADAQNYDGGELEIEGPSGVQAVKLDAGDLVLYPSTSLHRVTPVTRGARLAAFFWIESLVPDPTDRALLFDLDQAIQRLGADLPAADRRLVQLSGVYHNLLRRWALT